MQNNDEKFNLDLPISREPMLRGLTQLFMFPTSWMFAVDGKFFSIENGPIGFEKREKNSVIGILNGILTAIKQVSEISAKEGKLFSASQLKTIHQACMQNVETNRLITAGEFRKTDSSNVCYMEVEQGWSSPKGLADLVINDDGKLHQAVNSIENKAIVNPISLPRTANFEEVHKALEAKKQPKKLFIIFSKQHIESKIAGIIEEYNREALAIVKKPKVDVDKLINLLASITQQLMRTHPFSDGNNRTLVNCFLLSQCVFFGLSIFILREPNIFEFHTVKELAKKTNWAMATAQNFKENFEKNPDSKIYGFTPSSLKKLDTETQKIYKPILNVSKSFREGINQVITTELQHTNRSSQLWIWSSCASHQSGKSDKSAEVDRGWNPL